MGVGRSKRLERGAEIVGPGRAGTSENLGSVATWLPGRPKRWSRKRKVGP